MSDADQYDEFISGGSVAWSDVGLTIVGSVLWLIGVAVAEFIGLLEYGVLTALSGLSRFLTAVVSAPFGGSVDAMLSGWESAAGFVSTLGVAAFPAAVLFAVLFIALIVVGVRQLA